MNSTGNACDDERSALQWHKHGSIHDEQAMVQGTEQYGTTPSAACLCVSQSLPSADANMLMSDCVINSDAWV